MSTVEELSADVAEVRALLDQAQRPAVQAALRKVLTASEGQLRKAQEAEAAKAAALASIASEIETLEAQKTQAAEEEDFEKCASLRDQIAALKAKQANPAAHTPAPAPAAAAAAPQRPAAPGVVWTNLDKFSWDQGEYNTPWVNVYVPLDSVGTVKGNVSCDFTTNSFDLKIMGLNGRNYRLFKDGLDKDVVVEQCKFTVKQNRVTIKMRKVKGEYSYDNWTDLVPKRRKTAEQKAKEKDNPTAGIMDMMKDLYDDGDDQMKKVIGEAMLKSRSGDNSTPSLDD